MRSIRASAAPVEVRQLGRVGYDEAWQIQRELHPVRKGLAILSLVLFVLLFMPTPMSTY